MKCLCLQMCNSVVCEKNSIPKFGFLYQTLSKPNTIPVLPLAPYPYILLTLVKAFKLSLLLCCPKPDRFRTQRTECGHEQMSRNSAGFKGKLWKTFSVPLHKHLAIWNAHQPTNSTQSFSFGLSRSFSKTLRFVSPYVQSSLVLFCPHLRSTAWQMPLHKNQCAR